MVIDKWQKQYIESGLFNFHALKESTLPADIALVKSIKRTRRFFMSQVGGGDLHVHFIDNFYLRYKEARGDKGLKKGMFHNMVCWDKGIEQAAGYVIRDEICLRIALVAASEGLMRFE